nr:hypothetical protein [Tanacetum cinerariifolium]
MWIGRHDSNNNNGWIDKEDDEEMKEDDDKEMEEEDVEEMEEKEDEEEEEIDIGKVYPFGLVPLTIGTAMKRIRRMNEQIRKRVEVDEWIVKKIDRSDLRIWMVGRDAMSLDGAAKNAAIANDNVEDDDVDKDDVKDDHDMDDDVADPITKLACRIMPPKKMLQAAIAKLVADQVAKALAANRATRNTMGAGGSGTVEGAGNAGRPKRAKLAKDCTFSNFIKCGPTQFHGRDLTWWNTQVATRGLEVANEKSWYDLKRMMLEELCPDEEISRMEDELRHVRLKDNDIAAYTNRFNELVLLYPDNERIAEQNKRKWEGGNQGARAMTQAQNDHMGQRGNAPKCNRCNVFHFRNCSMKCNKCGKRRCFARDCHRKGVATGANVELIRACYKCRDKNHLANSDLYLERKKQGGRTASGHVYAVRYAEQAQGPNMVTEMFLLNNRYFSMLSDSGLDKSFINASLTHLFNIKPERISTSYEVELANMRIVRKYIKRGCHLFLAHVIENEKSKKRLEDVSVIRDFPEVFPDDLLGLPLPRQVEFKIDLVSGAAPIACAPYRLAPLEMKELFDN